MTTLQNICRVPVSHPRIACRLQLLSTNQKGVAYFHLDNAASAQSCVYSNTQTSINSTLVPGHDTRENGENGNEDDEVEDDDDDDDDDDTIPYITPEQR